MRKAVIAALAAALVVPAAASAGNYPPPSNPGKTPKARGKGSTLTVCKQGCRYKKVQKAIDAATGRDTIRVKKGVYHEGVQILGSRYNGLKLIGDPKHPDRVVFDGKGVPKGANQNAVIINAAKNVVVRGFHARNYKANCFFATNTQDYVLDHLVAQRCGNYGIYAFNSKGGQMTNSEAFYNPDSGFYVGQTPPQHGRVKRTLLKNLDSWGNVLGFSGTNMRYTTITKSRWYNNGAGIVPNVLDSEKYYPPTGNVISDNDVFWNNFNFYWGAPFKIPKLSAADIPYPIGVGILLFGSQNSVVENNRISGNYLAGFAEIPAVQLSGNKDPKKNEASILRNNTVRGNDFGAGSDLNGRDMAYDGSGSGNCFQGNTTRSPNFPADNSTFVPCPGTNTTADGVLSQLIAMSLGDSKNPASFEMNWIKHPHPSRKGVKPLERYRAARAGAVMAAAAKQVKKTVRIGDNFFAPTSLKVPRNSKITWRWPSNPGDDHDVYLRSGPKGVKKFHSHLAATDYSFTQTLKTPGLYKIICTIHQGMRMTVRVKK